MKSSRFNDALITKSGSVLALIMAAIGFMACGRLGFHSGQSRSDIGLTSVPHLRELTLPIAAYLIHQRQFAFTSIGGQVFCGFDPLGFQGETKRDRVYVWVYCQEFTSTNDPNKEGSGFSGPAVILLDHEGNIVGHEAPGDGNFEQDIPAMFPKSLVRKVFDYPSTINARRFLPASPEEQAKKAFASEPGKPIMSPVEGIVVPEGVIVAEEKPGYVRYRVPVGEPRPWIEWFSKQYPLSQGYRDWVYCGGGDAADGTGMSRSWSRGVMGLLLNVNYAPQEEEVEIIVATSKFNDCEHVE